MTHCPLGTAITTSPYKPRYSTQSPTLMHWSAMFAKKYCDNEIRQVRKTKSLIICDQKGLNQVNCGDALGLRDGLHERPLLDRQVLQIAKPRNPTSGLSCSRRGAALRLNGAARRHLTGTQPASADRFTGKVRIRPSDRRGDQSHEQRLRLQWPARQFGVELASDEIGMNVRREFDHLHDRVLGMPPGEMQSAACELLDVLWIDFVAMPEALADHALAVEQKTQQRVWLDEHILGAQPHGAAHTLDAALFRQFADDRMLAIRVEFG